MPDPIQSEHVLRFGVFEADVPAGELRKNGVKIKLQHQPFEVLVHLLEHSGKVVSREDLIQKLWPRGTVVEYEHSLATAVKKIRKALGDSADNPRFVETVPRRGYRFLAPVDRCAQPSRQRLRKVAPQPGGKISHYKIGDKLGEGGMGVVYKAEDTKLDRPVALKFLPVHLLGDEDIRKRFKREAKAAAALHHPNICPVYEVDEVDGCLFISMAFIEGDSLDKKIAQGPLEIKEALNVAQQIACGLEAAHGKGVFHRDIKPENIMVGEDGHVTIMDFGLAHLTEASRLTRDDATLGTVAYMSPEQTGGSGTDHRTDIWSLGVVLYEMITGRPPFRGDYDEAVMYSILNEAYEPLTALRAGVPIQLDWIVSKALAKQREERYQHVDELMVDLRPLSRGLSSDEATFPATDISHRLDVGRCPSVPSERLVSKLRSSTNHVLAAFTSLMFLAVVVVLFRQTPSAPEMPVRRFSLVPPSHLGITSYNTDVAISPNGRHIVFVTSDAESRSRKLWIQDLDRPHPRVIEGGEGAQNPFWSPASEWVGFTALGELRKISTQGGPVLRICRMPTESLGGAWSPDGEHIILPLVLRRPSIRFRRLAGTQRYSFRHKIWVS